MTMTLSDVLINIDNLGIDIHEYLIDIFYQSCKKGHLQVAKLIYSIEGENVHKISGSGFVKSCEYGYIDLAKWLVSIGTNINEKIECAFIRACRNNHSDIVKWLLELNTKINVLSNDRIENSFLDMIYYGNLDIMKVLYLHDKRRISIRTLLRAFSENRNQLNITKWLYKKIRNIYIFTEPKGLGFEYDIALLLFMNFRNNNFDMAKWTAYKICGKKKYDKIITIFKRLCFLEESVESAKWLYENIIVKFAIENMVNFTYDEIQNYCRLGRLDTLRWIFNIGKFDIHYDADQLLRIVCDKQWFEVMKLLCECGANIHVQDDAPFRICCFQNNLEMAKWLYNYAQSINSPINIHHKNDICFDKACENMSIELAKWLATLYDGYVLGESFDDIESKSKKSKSLKIYFDNQGKKICWCIITKYDYLECTSTDDEPDDNIKLYEYFDSNSKVIKYENEDNEEMICTNCLTESERIIKSSCKHHTCLDCFMEIEKCPLGCEKDKWNFEMIKLDQMD